MKTIVVGVDFGTSVVKATALDIKSGERVQFASTYQSDEERRTPAGWSATLERTLIALLIKLDKPVSVQSLAVTAMVPNVALVDSHDQAVGSLLFCDADAYSLELELDHQLKSPKWANEVLSKLLHLVRRSGPGKYRWFSTHNWLVYELTGSYQIDAVTAGECGTLIKYGSGWRSESLAKHGVKNLALPPIVAPCTVVGKVRMKYPIAEFRGVPVLAGTSDTVATSLGAGLGDQPGSLLVYYGTFNCAAIIRSSRKEILEGRLPHNPFDWILSVPRAGIQLVHLAQLIGLGSATNTGLSDLDRLASESPPGANGLVYLHADNLADTTVSSTPRGSIRHLEPRHSRADLARSVLEGFAYLVRWSLESNHLSPDRFPAIFAAGGGAQSSLWRQIVSDVSGLRQEYRPAADRGLGSALIALTAVGDTEAEIVYKTLGSETVATAPADTHRYREAYQLYISSWIRQLS